jgi:periplasmic protein TonB
LEAFVNPALRSIRIGLLAAFLGLVPAAGLLADTIYLKNGRQIQASNIVRQEGKLTFDTEGGEVTLSESLVDRIESDDPRRAPITISKPQAAHNAAPASRPMPTTPEATTREAKPEPVALKVQQHPSSFVVPRPMPAPTFRPADLRNADAPDVQQAALVLPTTNVPDVLPKIAASEPVPPREANTWFLSDSPAANFSDPRRLGAGASPNAGPSAATTVRPVQVGSFAPAVALEAQSGAESRAKEARVVPPGTFETVKMAPAPKPESAAIQNPQSPEQGVVVLSGPNPAYTDEARSLGIEGQVLLDVVFRASGEVKVNAVLKGLGHGLDDESIRAAPQIRFTPAMQQGRAVDFPATLHILFQLTF